MRYVLILLLASLAAAPGAEAATLDPVVVDAVNYTAAALRAQGKLSDEKEAELRDALSAAAADPKMANAIVFGATGNKLLRTAGARRGLFDLLLFDDSAWNDLAVLANVYSKDGTLSVVNYRGMATDKGRETYLRPDLDKSSAYADLIDIYAKARQLLSTPAEAMLEVHKHVAKLGDQGSGMSELEQELCNTGKFGLTGYDMSSARKDVAAFFESSYAFDYPDALDIEAVTPSIDPYDFICHKVTEGIRQDLRHMLIPLQPVVDKVLFPDTPKPKENAPPGDGAPNFDDLRNTPRGDGVPSYEQMQRYGSIPNTPYPSDSTLDSWSPSTHPSIGIESKWDRIAYGVDVCKYRQTTADQTLRTMGTTLRTSYPNTKCEVSLYLWYWGAKGTVAYFADGKSGSPEPPEGNRVYLQPSAGEKHNVKMIVTTDADGKGDITFFVRGRCAVTVEEFYFACPLSKIKSSGGKK